MNQNRIVVAALAFFLGAAELGVVKASAAPLRQPQAYGQDREWQVPPGEFNEIQRRGFHDGQEGAQKDFGNNRRPDVDNREEYRDPHIEPEFREAYRAAFRRGYEVAASHLWGVPRLRHRWQSRHPTGATGRHGPCVGWKVMLSARAIVKA